MTSEPLEIDIDATHLYPGARGHFAGRLPASGVPTTCTLIFSDFTRVGGVIVRDGEGGARLDVGSYVTAAGTKIAAKAWRISLSWQVERADIRVRARLI